MSVSLARVDRTEELSLRDMEVPMAIPVPSPFISGAAVM